MTGTSSRNGETNFVILNGFAFYHQEIGPVGLRWAGHIFRVGNQETMQILGEISWQVATGKTEKEQDGDKEIGGEWVT